ncbi:Single-stranded nucleic acid-binding protein [Hanseniaspora osmophila]|uniref:Single-stranded nucleic acid-binding protein n=1 Tax=Hanseniaspora osmophila TaxID=56408 RepID=A0A1E5RFG1_9ASCO|nr:Single-stranded nucleic acid-binding protein [Hanseniaspora osmophila]
MSETTVPENTKPVETTVSETISKTNTATNSTNPVDAPSSTETDKDLSEHEFQRGSHRGNGRGNYRGRGNGRGNHRGGRGGRGGASNFVMVSSRRRSPDGSEPSTVDEHRESRAKSQDTLFVRNIPFRTTREELAEFFDTDVENIVMPLRKMKDLRTNKIVYNKYANRGMAFVKFPSLSSDAPPVEEGKKSSIEEKIGNFNGVHFKDRPLIVDIAMEKPVYSKPEEKEEEEEEEEEEGQEVANGEVESESVTTNE